MRRPKARLESHFLEWMSSAVNVIGGAGVRDECALGWTEATAEGLHGGVVLCGNA